MKITNCTVCSHDHAVSQPLRFRSCELSFQTRNMSSIDWQTQICKKIYRFCVTWVSTRKWRFPQPAFFHTSFFFSKIRSNTQTNSIVSYRGTSGLHARIFRFFLNFALATVRSIISNNLIFLFFSFSLFRQFFSITVPDTQTNYIAPYREISGLSACIFSFL